MTTHARDRRIADRRRLPDRRSGDERRVAAASDPRPEGDRRQGRERRNPIPRRAGIERRACREGVGEHVRNALQLLENAARLGSLDEDAMADVVAAIGRLRFALRRLESAPPDPAG